MTYAPSKNLKIPLLLSQVLHQLIRFLTKRSKPVIATMARNGESADFGVPVVPGGVVNRVVGKVVGNVVFLCVGLVTGNRGAGVNVSSDVNPGSPRRSYP